MAAAPDGDGLSGVEFGPAPVAGHGGLSQPLPDIQAGHPGGGFHDPLTQSGHVVTKFPEKIVFQRFALFAGGQQLVFEFFERRGDVALAVGQGLAALEMGRGVAGGLGQLEIVAKDPVEAELELGQIAGLLFPGQQLLELLLAVLGQIEQFVQFGMVAGPEQPAFGDKHRR